MATGTTTRVFLARLAGITVLDPNADQVGRVRDVVVVLRTEAQPPRVLGLVVEVQPRRRVFMPIGQVTSIDAEAVIVRGRINLRRFERRPGETLVITDLLEELPEDDQVEIIAHLEGERAADVLEAMAPDDAADLLAELPPDEQERLLALMEPDEADPVRRLLTYAEGTAGGMMTTEPVVLPPDATVAEALARVRDPELTPALASQVFVCRPPTETPTGKFLGIAHIQRLLREPPSTLVAGVADSDIGPLGPDVTLAEVTSYLATYNLVAVPIVDDADHLLGAVTVDDVLDHLLPANWRERPSDDAGGHRGT